MSSINNTFPNNPQQQQPPPRRRRRRRRTRRHVIPTTVPTTTPTENISSSFRFSDSDAHSSMGGSSGIFSYNHSRMTSSDDEDEIDLESGELELKVHSKNERICRICHLNFDGDGVRDGDSDGDGDGGGVIELGCNCKGDLGAAHKQCAETWFKIRGNLTCEICGATAHNVGGEQTNDTSNAIETEPAERSGTGFMPVLTETRTFWQGRRIMNILLGCMVFAFIISWLFHFNVLP
ncbi:putative zinc finger, RING-CH-type, zinc finger, RING/FYVE/PHD-type containing protein [Tanacetum coccineum]